MTPMGEQVGSGLTKTRNLKILLFDNQKLLINSLEHYRIKDKIELSTTILSELTLKTEGRPL